VFNVGSGDATNLLDLLAALNALAGTKMEPNFAPPRAGDVRDSLAEISQARQILDYRPVCDLRTGLERTLDYYRSAASN
jgi:nucleoside-diphosphate-sugar epimerase